MSRRNQIVSRALADEVRRQSELEQLKRFVRSLPAFQPDAQIPPRFVDLLGRIDEAEQQSGSRRRG
ncbi:hypothetical protein EET67_14200 [Pseudaminobacter arsenicus]|uniref:Anti-sigma factor NepR domain-containing protein n=1 Tax=Borborobacter arsenicus TaxID=1851146 RepID=A0A432V4I5_9HYPH|nr:hypothetical protein EET67_14200 [Pseudaminobacter arsenicus]